MLEFLIVHPKKGVIKASSINIAMEAMCFKKAASFSWCTDGLVGSGPLVHAAGVEAEILGRFLP